jgi:hypothetical protein
MVKKLIIKRALTDKEISEKEGHYFDESHYKLVIKEDTDVYILDTDNPRKMDESNLLLSFRKKVFTLNECKNAFKALEKHSHKKHNNRGSAAGLLKTDELPNYVKETTDTTKFRAYYIGKDGTKKKDHISNYVKSGIIGYFDRYDRNIFNKKYQENKKTKEGQEMQEIQDNRVKQEKPIPCRMTQFTRDEVEKWKMAIPLIESADKIFKKLVPDRHQKQLERARETPDYKISDTSFSTVTINYNYQTATHKDKGDYEDGFGNLIVLEKSKCQSGAPDYKGGYLGFPQYKVCVDIRQGDFIAMNVHEWHCNTPITSGCVVSNNNIKNSEKSKTNEHGRLSMVCYLRKNMIKCKK